MFYRFPILGHFITKEKRIMESIVEVLNMLLIFFIVVFACVAIDRLFKRRK